MVRQHYDDDHINQVVAYHASRSPDAVVMDKIAKDIARLAKIKARPHYKSGDLEKGIVAKRHRTKAHHIIDRVVLVDRDVIGHIEYGHYQGPRELGDARPWIDGLHILRRAARSYDRHHGINRAYRKG